MNYERQKKTPAPSSAIPDVGSDYIHQSSFLLKLVIIQLYAELHSLVVITRKTMKMSYEKHTI